MENNPEKFNNSTHEDKRKMDALAQKVKDLLDSEENRPQKKVLEDSEHILYEELQKDANLIMEEIGDAFRNVESAKKIFRIIPEKLKWEDSKIRMMMEILGYALKEFYSNDFIGIDENWKSLDFDRNKYKKAILQIIKEDGGYEEKVIKEIEPLVNACLQKISEILREKKRLGK